MRGEDERSGSLFSYVDLEARVGQSHPLRAIRALVNEALAVLVSDFSALYSPIGRPSIPPEKLLRAMLLQAFYSIRSERQLMERLEFDLLFRWFVGLGIDEAVWNHSVFSENRDRLPEGEIAAKFLERGIGSARREAAFEYGAFFGRRHANRSLGVDEELQTNRWVERTSCGWRWTEPGKGLSRPEAIERNAHLDHRSRSEALS
jgi:transposase